MGRYLWLVRFAAGVVLTVVAAVNLVQLPSNLLAVAVGVVMLILLLWSELERRADAGIPEGHADELRTVATRLLGSVDARQRPEYSSDPELAAVLEASFRSHFGSIASELHQWAGVVDDLRMKVGALESRIRREATTLEEQHGVNVEHNKAVITRACNTQVVQSPPAVPVPTQFDLQQLPHLGWVLFLGGSGIAQADSPDKLKAAQSAFTVAVAGVKSWDEVVAVRDADLAVSNARSGLRQRLTEVSRTHIWKGQCRLCTRP